uniref:Osteoclast-stimulating factor 1 n=1 Tax=Acanthochromis polyacanthus TaxID=80966 RepID=A0A3Q1F1H2_9TELE
MEATAKYDFQATADDDLSFRKGDCLKILQTSGNWYKAELNRVKGFVPKNFINIHLPSWYQENASRSDAQQSLMSQPVGAFLIRGRQNAGPGEFSISVRHPTDVQHFKVLQDSRGQYYLWSEKFPSLNQLVEYYKSNSISIKRQIFLQETQTKVGTNDSKPNLSDGLKPNQKQEGSDSLPHLPAPADSRPLCDRVPSQAPRQVVSNAVCVCVFVTGYTDMCVLAVHLNDSSPTMQVRALYDFQAEETDELEFNAGDIIEVLESSDQAWWKDQLGDKTGLFPFSYTKPI